jgi:hypothetical protein
VERIDKKVVKKPAGPTRCGFDVLNVYKDTTGRQQAVNLAVDTKFGPVKLVVNRKPGNDTIEGNTGTDQPGPVRATEIRPDKMDPGPEASKASSRRNQHRFTGIEQDGPAPRIPVQDDPGQDSVAAPKVQDVSRGTTGRRDEMHHYVQVFRRLRDGTFYLVQVAPGY